MLLVLAGTLIPALHAVPHGVATRAPCPDHPAPTCSQGLPVSSRADQDASHEHHAGTHAHAAADPADAPGVPPCDQHGHDSSNCTLCLTYNLIQSGSAPNAESECLISSPARPTGAAPDAEPASERWYSRALPRGPPEA